MPFIIGLTSESSLALLLWIDANLNHLVYIHLFRYNYPTFLGMYANAMYVVLSFTYILPVAKFGWFHGSIPVSHLTSMSKKPFMVMGFLDAMASSMQVLATVYLPGKLLVLLPQAAIPLSMLASRIVLREHFTPHQCLGAMVVFSGIVVVLFPIITYQHAPEFSCQATNGEEYCIVCEAEKTKEDCESHRQDSDPFLGGGGGGDTIYCQWISKQDSLRHDDTLTIIWSLVLLASCIPMVCSCVYKQVALQVQLDPILVNGWVAVFQFLFGLLLVVPAGYASSPKVKPLELVPNWWHASGCLFAQNNSVEGGCHPDDCAEAALWIHLGILSSVVYTVSMILVLKYGSASLLYLGLTVTVPLGHFAFSLRAPSKTHVADITGLIVLVAGLVLYRFGHEDEESQEEVVENSSPTGEGEVAYSPLNTSGQDSRVNDKNGFLEFLREPFMLVGDI